MTILMGVGIGIVGIGVGVILTVLFALLGTIQLEEEGRGRYGEQVHGANNRPIPR